MKISFVTNNKLKVQVARNSLHKHGITVKQIVLDLPEIQSDSVKEIAIFSAKNAALVVGQPVIVGDTGFFVESLGGFPGPYLKYINEKLSPVQFSRLYSELENPTAYFLDALCYCKPAEQPVCFLSKTHGHLVSKPKGRSNNMIETLFVPKGDVRTLAEIPHQDQIKLWSNERYAKLAKLLTKNRDDNR